jgi:transcriptional regulator GlxA family with amidase domain
VFAAKRVLWTIPVLFVAWPPTSSWRRSTRGSAKPRLLDGVAHLHPIRHLLRAKDLMDARYREPLDVPSLARTAHLSPAHFSREFKRAFGETPHQYLLTRRLERAASLLRTTDRTVAEVCLAVGLRGVGSFTTSFGRAFGLSPGAYRSVYPPALERVPVPTCVRQAYARPHSSFREDAPARRG